jgi:predicted nucleic acid-binding Zn ribbon protein
MRRPRPRPLHLALEAFAREAAPATVLARVQAEWPRVAGPAVADEAEPVAERGGTLTVACRSAAWAQELSMAGPDVVRRLNAALDPTGPGPLRELRVRTGRPPPARSEDPSAGFT